jgi:hypothetical protein
VLISALTAIDSSGIEYVSWKNNHELQYSITGKSDLDIFVPLKFRRAAVDILHSRGWAFLKESSLNYPWVEHCYFVNCDGVVFHLNIYFKVVTGESWLKEYVLPLGDFLIKERRRGLEEIWVLSESAQAYIFYLRHLIKNASLLSRFVYLREFSSYSTEWSLCAHAVKAGMLPKKALERAKLTASGGIERPSWRSASKFRLSLIPSLRFPLGLLSLYRYAYLCRKIFFRKILGRKKESLGQGLVFALSGGDGAGKSSMLAYILDLYSGFMTVKVVRLGRPQNHFIESVRRLFVKKSTGNASAEKSPRFEVPRPSLGKAVSAVVLALLRLREAKRAMRWSQKGYLVLSDRWPTQQAGKMDGPKLTMTKDDKGAYLYACLLKLERWLYEAMPPCDVCVVLNVSVETAIERNRERIKYGKETDAEIIARHVENTDHLPLASELVCFDNNGDFVANRARLAGLLWSCLAARIP